MSFIGFCPPGVVMPFASLAATPSGWLTCDGAIYSQTDYPRLYAALSGTYNTAIDPTTGAAHSAPASGFFRVPDYRGTFLRGAGTPFGLSTTVVGDYQDQQFQTHTHNTFRSSGLTPGASALVGDASSGSLLGTTSGPITGNPGNETRPINYTISWIIKT